MTLMSRPVQVSTLISTVKSALRDRCRQYAVREMLEERRRTAEAFREERERYRVTLTSIGDAVITTDTEHLEAAEQFRPDVILMDVGMPRLNGLDATRQIRSNSWGTSTIIIALTGWGQVGDHVQSKEAGCDGHLVKPVSLSDLEKVLADLSENRTSKDTRTIR